MIDIRGLEGLRMSETPAIAMGSASSLHPVQSPSPLGMHARASLQVLDPDGPMAPEHV